MMMVTLVEHARAELARAGEDPALSAAVVAAVAVLDSVPHTREPQDAVLDMLVRLARREALTPLTKDPAEWEQRTAGDGVWWSIRDPRAYSEDAGQSYRLVDDGVLRPAAVPAAWARALAEKRGLTFHAAVLAVEEYCARVPLTDEDRHRLRGGVVGDREAYMRRRWGPQGWLVAELLYEPEPGGVLAGVG